MIYHASILSGSDERDVNGRMILRPCSINSPPVIIKNQCIVVKVNTHNYYSWSNGSFLVSFHLPDFAANGKNVGVSPLVSLNPAKGEFVGAGMTANLISINGNSPSLIGYDPIRQQWYVNNPGDGYWLVNSASHGEIEDDTGGLSMGSGYLLATDARGQLAMIPADTHFTPVAGQGTVGPFPPPAPGPTPPLAPAPLGPIVVYPNPFNPAKAVGGVAKFRNLPDNAYVEHTDPVQPPGRMGRDE
jgi:hypothetical protein